MKKEKWSVSRISFVQVVLPYLFWTQRKDLSITSASFTVADVSSVYVIIDRHLFCVIVAFLRTRCGSVHQFWRALCCVRDFNGPVIRSWFIVTRNTWICLLSIMEFNYTCHIHRNKMCPLRLRVIATKRQHLHNGYWAVCATAPNTQYKQIITIFRSTADEV